MARYKVIPHDGTKYSVFDTLPGLVVSICKNEDAAKKRAHVLNNELPPSDPIAIAKRAARVAEAKQRAAAKQIEEQARKKENLRFMLLRSQVKRFWEQVEKTDWCWLWLGSRAAHGFPQYSVKGIHMLAHRYSYILENGNIPEGYEVTRQCGERACVNPAHLVALTPEERRRLK